MSEIKTTIDKVRLFLELSGNKEVNALANIFLEYLINQEKLNKKPIGFSGEKK